ncbi:MULTISPECIES: efflux RND transporter periplasmic adaptor subunit [Methylosinus]|uniref:MexH family multidrug efflux RND transporter periplasmic adaptor subunit n=1 Tax=Methylosinus trichosporium (strain ATCC 35070 / NCIMB 11131 / UNIQEM 75 / OB3b) TaxID=595536 RepID=A0A2D2D377_METT3|nr:MULTISPECIES: efflux RND transporter periplasmic adaptor subunit [Methylosinus]ATQ69424.1 MexH family multidrug efflux RND transporter periplasmic adaptor subunit [Methylosinus trichosporium OB3b]OBS52934.1 efflux transporter periplasmic adaptor subunit [Methylosinus sp. 3S-1]
MTASASPLSRKRLGATKPMAIMLAIVAVVFGLLYGFVVFRSAMIKQFLAGMANPPQTVTVTKAAFQEWRPKRTAVGTFRAVNGSDLSLEVAGIVEKIHFQSGEQVAEGQLLLELRKDTDTTRLASLQASADLAGITLRRDQSQLKLHATSQATVDTDVANLKSADAQVAQQEAVIAQKTLRAPFAGRLGIRSVDLGQYIGAGSVIVTLQALDPIFLDFLLPQQALNGVEVGQPIDANVDAFPGKKFTGKIVAINSKVDQASRNVQVRASLANADHKLTPGMFAEIDIVTGHPERRITLPQTAIVYAPFGNSVFLVQQNAADKSAPAGGLTAQQVFVRLGATRGDEVAVLEGVPEGATVVTAGQVKLRNGSPLKISDAPQPPVDPDPKPVDQ